MKVLFICGSLESGRDGVGDYSRRLAGELIRQGHPAGIIAYNDRHIEKQQETEQKSDGITIPVLRLPSKWGANQKRSLVKRFVKIFNPDWLSLQYVPFAFQDKGLPLGLAKQLKEIGKGRKWHIMFHELWVGMEKNTPLTVKMWGKFQKLLIRKLIKVISPALVNTQISLYQDQLQSININARILPLFGNIPVSYNFSPKGTDKIHFVLFGGIHRNCYLNEFLDEIKNVSTHREVIFDFIGRNGAELQNWITCIKERRIKYRIQGEQSEKQISKVLSEATIGLSTTPFVMTGKSGSVAAMKEHNLPVICLAQKWDIDQKYLQEPYSSVIQYTPPGEICWSKLNNTGNSLHYLPLVTRKLIQSLEENG
jgi:hypothetical protein